MSCKTNKHKQEIADAQSGWLSPSKLGEVRGQLPERVAAAPLTGASPDLFTAQTGLEQAQVMTMASQRYCKTSYGMKVGSNPFLRHCARTVSHQSW